MIRWNDKKAKHNNHRFCIFMSDVKFLMVRHDELGLRRLNFEKGRSWLVEKYYPYIRR
jgi:hypothetical protein